MKLSISNSSRIIISLGLISIILTAYKYCSVKLVVIYIILFSIFANEVNCKLYGSCNVSSIITMLIPFIFTFLLILDFFGVFETYKKRFNNIYSLVEIQNKPYVNQLITNSV